MSGPKPYEMTDALPWAYAKNPQFMTTLTDRDALRAERDALKARVREERELALTAEDALKASETERHRLTARVAELSDLADRYDKSGRQDRIERQTAEAALKVEREAHAATHQHWATTMALLLTRERGLRTALVDLVQYERKRHPPKMGGDELPPSLRKLVEAADAALAAPAGEVKHAFRPMVEDMYGSPCAVCGEQGIHHWSGR